MTSSTRSRRSLRDGSYAMGATKSETIKRVVLPAALPGIVSAFMLAISRAIGETMIVVMAAGLAANLSFNPLDGGHHDHRADRHLAGRRPGIRFGQNPFGLCARLRAVLLHPGFELHRTSHRAEIP